MLPPGTWETIAVVVLNLSSLLSFRRKFCPEEKKGKQLCDKLLVTFNIRQAFNKDTFISTPLYILARHGLREHEGDHDDDDIIFGFEFGRDGLVVVADNEWYGKETNELYNTAAGQTSRYIL